MRIEPTIGRVVLYHPSEHDGMVILTDEQPLDAHIVYVHEDGARVNLVVFDHHGYHHARHNVELVQHGNTVPGAGGYCEWMPYQIGQAKKHAEGN